MTQQQNPVVILDKSYLFGANREEIHSLCDNYRVLATPGLIYELLKEDEPSRNYCFNKFPDRDHPVELIDRVGVLLRYETKNLAPCGPIYEHRLPYVFRFNEYLALGNYEGSTELWATMEKERQQLYEMTKGFLECAKFIPDWCPDLEGYKAGSSKEMIEELQMEVGRDLEVARSLYRRTHDDRFPSADIVGPEWAHFRRLQLWVIAGLDYIFRYGLDNFSDAREKVIHTYIDIHYGIYGTLSGALATRDQFLKRAFRYMCPDGLLIE